MMRERAAGKDSRSERGAPRLVVGGLAPRVPSCASGLRWSGAAGERKVDATAVRVGVTQVRHHEDVCTERAADAVIEPPKLRPGRSDLHRVREEPCCEHGGLSIAHGVSVKEP